MSEEVFIEEEAPKDRWGRYKIELPTGKTVGYTRVTTIAKATDDTGSLADWKTRMALTGIVKRPDLLAQASTALEDRNKMNKIAQDAIDAAGAFSRANLGTALHSITQQVDLGLKPSILPGLQADINAYSAGVKAFGFNMPKEFIEVLLINDDMEYAGTADRIVMIDGEPTIFDLKTGTDLSYSYGSIAIQLALYANAEWIYDWKTGQRIPMPDIDKTRGVICHLPAGEARCDFYNVNLVDGWAAAQLSFQVRNWRKRKDLFSPYKPYQPTEKRIAEPEVGLVSTASGSTDLLAERRLWLKARIEAMTPAAQQMLKLLWPKGVGKVATLENDGIDQVVAACVLVEAEHSLPFFDQDPATPKAKPGQRAKKAKS